MKQGLDVGLQLGLDTFLLMNDLAWMNSLVHPSQSQAGCTELAGVKVARKPSYSLNQRVDGGK